ncbi:neprilysin-1-like [Hylaeus anthracinus]|uniref:neprilysin-1-like n=1 Tax=Hylaeus anthracinus TaxID=313031 RepID=UPI0023BA36C3|nr:neprilysin-1-like [Hylaeus anthracinus]
MPSRGSYQVTSKEEGEAAERDQSYRSCVLALVIFFFLCILLIIVSLPWKHHTHHYEHQDEYLRKTQVSFLKQHQQSHERRPERTTTTTESVKHYLDNHTFSNEPEDLNTTTSKFEVSTQNYNVTSVTSIINSSSEFEKPLYNESTTEREISTLPVTDVQLYEESSTTETISLSENFNSTETTSSSLTTEGYSEKNINESEIYTTQPSTSTDSNIVSEQTSSDIYEITTGSVIMSTTDSEETTRIETTTDYVLNATTDYTTISTLEGSITGRPTTTTSEYRLKRQVCTTGECKNIASKMLFYMNHTVDPCDDFYEYACGGFEANPQTIQMNLENAAYQRILRQSQKDVNSTPSYLFTKYYNSCMQYENINLTERTKLARGVLDRVGKFYTIDSWAKNHTNFTELVARLLLHDSALLFDISPDIDEFSSKQFTLKIGPTTYKSHFDVEETEDPCYTNQYERDQETVDLGELYKEYKTCKNNTKKFIKSITEALIALDVFSELDNPYNITQYVHTTVINIDFEIVQNFFTNYPSKDKIREAYLMKNYTRVSIENLQAATSVVDWTHLIYVLTKAKVLPNAYVQVYFYDALIKGLKNLAEFEARDAAQLNNALLGLYAHNLYHKLVLSKHTNPKEHCLRIVSNVLVPEASNLYVSSFSNEELLHMNTTIHSLFEELKETLKSKINEAEWVVEGGRNELIAKINDLKVTVPDVSYFTDSASTYRKTHANEVNLSDNYFENSVTLMQRYRVQIYTELFKNPGDPEQIWTHYATPFQSKGLAIYILNLVVIPYGVIDWSIKYDKPSFDYIRLATLGNVLAHQIAHHFDANGIYYWNGTRDTEYSLLNGNDYTNSNFKDYIRCQQDELYGSPITMTLPSTGQTVSCEISQLSLNERLSETMGLRLAYDTLDRLRSREEVHLPWLELDSDQLFYLTYAQMHCTKSPLTSSYVSLYEDEQLPSRIRIFVSASNNRLLGEAWKCPEGSGIIPSYTCSVFPYLPSSDVTGVTLMRK